MDGQRFLLVTWEGGGVVPPEMGVARRLVDRGHQVRVLADPTIEHEAKAAGCAFTPWTTAPHCVTRTPDGAVIRDWEHHNPLAMMRTYLRDFLADPAPRWAADVDAALQAEPFDALLVDFAVPAATIPAHARDLPVVVLMPNIWILPTKGIPPLGAGWRPATNPATKTRDAIVRLITRKIFDRALPALNATRADYGLEPRASAQELMTEGTVLVLSSPRFDFTSPFQPANVTYAGPVLDDPTWAEPFSPPWGGDDPRPLVLASLSSGFQDQQAILQRIVDGLATVPTRAVVTTGNAIDPGALRVPPGPGQVAVLRSAPHAPLLREAAVVVTHAGHGTTMKALAAGVPLVCLPMGRDQNDTAARVVHRGAGIRLKTSASPAAIAAAVEEVLADPTYADAAQRLSEAITNGDGCVDPVAAIEHAAAARALD